MRKNLFVVLCFFTAATTQAAFLPFFDGIRAAITDRQVAISNAPPITSEGKKELKVLSGALKTIDKPSTSLATDLKNLSGIVTKVNKGASNGVLGLQFRTAVSNYYGVLIATNDALVAILADANNNPALKAKAQEALEAAQVELAGINAETDLNGAAKGLGTVLKSYLKAARAVTAAANAEPTPLPNAKSGTVVVEVAGLRLVFGAEFPPREINPTGAGIVGEGEADGSASQLVVHIPSTSGPGTYTCGWLFNDTVDGTSITFAKVTGDAEVTSASASALVGTISGTAQVRINGGDQQILPFTAKFNARKFSFLP